MSDQQQRGRKTCKRCKRPTNECGQLSRYGNCTDCAIELQAEAARQMAAKEGPYYDRWLASAGGRHT